jgi:transposase-like protein
MSPGELVEHEASPPTPIGETAENSDAAREALVAELAETFDPLEVVRVMLRIGLRYSDLALALDVHPRTVRAWLESDERDPGRHRDAILTLKSVVLFLLRRGILSPEDVALWLVEPNPKLGFRRPLAVLTEEGGIHDVISASATFTRPEPRRTPIPTSNKAVAAGATGRREAPEVRALGNGEGESGAPGSE